MRRFSMLACPAVVLTLAGCAAGDFARSGPLTEDEVEARYMQMDRVHIRKCDRNGDGLYDGGEMGCVRGIHQTMYVDD